MTRHARLFATATRFVLIEHGRNRFAIVLVVLFLPAWTTLAYLAMPAGPGCSCRPPGSGSPHTATN